MANHIDSRLHLILGAGVSSWSALLNTIPQVSHKENFMGFPFFPGLFRPTGPTRVTVTKRGMSVANTFNRASSTVARDSR